MKDAEHSRRFGGLDRLYGEGARKALHDGRVAVVGVGGVGSWTVEALARSGVGHITLIDFDQVAVSNVNRQIHALDSTRGMSKVRALEHRIRDINPDCHITAIEEFLTADNVNQLIPEGAYDIVVDASDNARAKAALIAHALPRRIAVVVCGAAGGKNNPLRLRVSDLGRTEHDALLSRVRKTLRSQFNVRSGNSRKYGVPCVYSEEPLKRTDECSTNDLNCAGYGSTVTLTAPMGFALAAWCVDRLLEKRAKTEVGEP